MLKELLGNFWRCLRVLTLPEFLLLGVISLQPGSADGGFGLDTVFLLIWGASFVCRVSSRWDEPVIWDTKEEERK